MFSVENVEERYVSELRLSGITYLAHFLGSVPVNSTPTTTTLDREELISECIMHICGRLQFGPHYEITKHRDLVCGDVDVNYFYTEMNFTTRNIKVIDNYKLLHCHPMKFMSHCSQGKGQYEYKFGYIAKNNDGTNRRCFVFGSNEARSVLELIEDCLRVGIFDKNLAAGLPTGYPELPPHRTIPSGFFARTQEYIPGPKRKLPDVDYDVQAQPWFHRNMTTAEAKELFTNPGDFLVRQSKQNPAHYVLTTLNEDGNIRNLYLLDDQRDVISQRNMKMGTISELITYHLRTRNPIVTECDNMVHLRKPIYRKKL